MSEFNRTTPGQAAKFLFFAKPLVWVEGSQDLPFYHAILEGIDCRVEPAGGRHQCERLAKVVLEDDAPFVVVIDGDYELIAGRRKKATRVIRLRRYSAENYLCEAFAIDSVCRNYLGRGPDEVGCESFRAFSELVQKKLLTLVSLDAGHVLAQTGKRALPEAAEGLLEAKGLALRKKRIGELLARGRVGLSLRNRQQYRLAVTRFCKRRRLLELIPGKVALGFVRRLIWVTISKGRRRLPSLDNEGLRLLLVREVWSSGSKLSPDHKTLKQTLRFAVKEAAARRAKGWPS